MKYLKLFAYVYLWASSILYLILGLGGVATLPDLRSFNLEEFFGWALFLGIFASFIGLTPLRFFPELDFFSPVGSSLALQGFVAVILSILGFITLVRGSRWHYSGTLWYGVSVLAFIMALDNFFLIGTKSGLPNWLPLFGLLHATLLTVSTLLVFKITKE